MRHITVIDGHPDPSDQRLNHALADRYTHAARAAGCEVRRINLSQLHVPVLRSVTEFYNEEAPASLRDAQRDIAWADHLAFFYPLWHGTVPALFKAFIEQTFRPGFAMDYGGKNRFPKALLKGKSARIIVTMGMPAFIYKSYFGAHGVKSFERSTLGLCGIRPIDETLLGGAGGERAVKSAQWLDLMDTIAEEDASPQLRRRRKFAKRLARNAILTAVCYAAYLIASSTGREWMRTPESNGQEPSTTPGSASPGAVTREHA
jgi:putative NADPH-quinone reductase